MRHYLTITGRLVKVSTKGFRGKVSSGKRGKIRGFSNKSRRRLIEMMLMATVPPDYFITLTVQQIMPDEAFRVRLRYFLDGVLARDKGKVFVIWRLEKQKRNVLHAHLLMWKKRGYKFCHKWPVLKYSVFDDWVKNFKPVDLAESRWLLYHGLTNDWEDALTYFSVKWCGLRPYTWEEANRAVDVKEIGSFDLAAKYVGKYVAKAPGEVETFNGRVWGYRGNKELPKFADSRTFVLGDEQREILLAILKELYMLYGKDYARVVIENFPAGGSIYMNEKDEMELLLELVQEYVAPFYIEADGSIEEDKGDNGG